MVEPDFTVTHVELTECWFREYSSGFLIKWGTKSAGFGEMTVTVKDGIFRIQNEAMSKEFLKQVFAKLVDDAILEE